MGYDLDPNAKNRVLAVVQDERLRDTLDRGLGRHGFGFTPAQDPEAVANHFSADAPPEFDVVLFDLQPQLVARTQSAVRKLRQTGNGVPAAVLVSASLASSLPPDPAIQLVLVKPIDLAELALELRRLATSPRQSSA